MKHVYIEDEVHRELAQMKLDSSVKSLNDVIKGLLGQANESTKK